MARGRQGPREEAAMVDQGTRKRARARSPGSSEGQNGLRKLWGTWGHLGVREEEGTCSCFQGIIEGEEWHLGLEDRRWV